MALDTGDLRALFRTVVDIESVSRKEGRLADEVEETLRGLGHLEVLRTGNTVAARTRTGQPSRVVVAGHLDTVPVRGNLPSTVIGEGDNQVLVGRGAADMKGGIAVMLALAVELTSPSHELTWIFYESEEIEHERNGLTLLARQHRDWLDGDLAILMEPTNGLVEAGCQGSMRFTLTTQGLAAHSARPWQGRNAIHAMADVLERVREFGVREVPVDGLVYRESLNATTIQGGVAGNVIPDACTVQVNYRYAPDKSPAQAEAAMRMRFRKLGFRLLDMSPPARPGLDAGITRDFLAHTGLAALPKFGWTDVARFALLGIPALNYGPADPGRAHADDECCSMKQVEDCAAVLRSWLVRR